MKLMSKVHIADVRGGVVCSDAIRHRTWLKTNPVTFYSYEDRRCKRCQQILESFLSKPHIRVKAPSRIIVDVQSNERLALAGP